MDFGLTAEQKLLHGTLRDFARRELLPNYASRDADQDLPPALVKKLGEMGLLAPMVATHLGGSKLDYVSLGIAHEEIALAAGAKWLAPELCADVLHQCILLHGHLGFSLDLPHQQRMRDVIGLEIGDGTAQIMKTIVAREIIGKTARPY